MSLLIKNIKENINTNKNSDINLGKCRQVKQKNNISFKEIKYLLNNKYISNDIVNNYYDQNLLCVDYEKLENKNLITQCFNIINRLKNYSKEKIMNPNNKSFKEIMSDIFGDCSSLHFLDLSNFYTNNVTNMSLLFYKCSSLIDINLSNFNTKNVSNMIGMFYNCSSLTK